MEPNSLNSEFQPKCSLCAGFTLYHDAFMFYAKHTELPGFRVELNQLFFVLLFEFTGKEEHIKKK